MPKRSKTEAAKSKVETATALSALGGAVGGPLGAGIGAIGGLIIGDKKLVMPLDMIAIPAYQAFMIEGTPSLQIYLRAGETLTPTGGNVKDVLEAVESEEVLTEGAVNAVLAKKPNAYQKRYMAAFRKIAPKYTKKDGKFKKDGFRKTVKAAHAEARKGN